MAAPYGKPPAPYGAPQGYPGGPPGAYGAPPPGAPGGYPPPGQYGAPPPGAPGGYPPPGQYGAPPPGQYGAPPPGQYGAPPPGQYGAKPPAGAPPGQYGAPPPGQYGAPPPGQYGAPPPGQYGAPPPGQYGAPPGGAPYGAPPPGQYGAPPPGQYGAPPGQYGAKPPAAPYGAPPGQYGAPPPGQYGAPPGQYGAPPGQYGAPAPGHYGAPPGQYGAAPGQPQAWGAKPPAGGAGGWNVAADPRKNAFMSALKQNLTRDYVILVDKSGSMQGQRWHDANVALQALAGEVCRADPDGATLVFFSTAGTLLRYGNVTSGGKVNELFSTVYPGGTTDLGGALTAVLNEHFDPSRAKPGYPPGHAPTTVLIITDGEPDDAGEVVRVLVNASNALLADAELSVTFIQVGDDEDAARFLRTLDDGLVPKGARFDIVDTITKDKMMGLSFADLIFKSLHD